MKTGGTTKLFSKPLSIRPYSLNGRRAFRMFTRGMYCAIMLGLVACIASANARPVLAQEVASPETDRVWISGEYKVTATLVDVTGDQITLKKKEDGAEVSVPLARLSTEDQDYIADYLAKKSELTDPDPVTPDENTLPAVTPEVMPAAPNTTDRGSSPDNGSRLNLPTPSFPDDSSVSIQTRFHEIETPEITISESEIAALPSPLNRIARAIVQPGTQTETLEAFLELDLNWSDSHSPTLVRVVQFASDSDDKFFRLNAIQLLGKRAPVPNLVYFLKAIDDESYEVRHASLDLVAVVGDPSSIGPLVHCFPGRDRIKIGQILENFGSVVEVPIQQYLTHESDEVRIKTGLLLKRIGTEISLPAIEEQMGRDSNKIVVLQLQAAAREINKRMASPVGTGQQDNTQLQPEFNQGQPETAVGQPGDGS